MKRELPFTMAEYQKRLDMVRAQMEERGIDVLVLVGPVTINYLTGSLSRGAQYFAIPLKGKPAMLAWELELPLVLYSSWLDEGVEFHTGEDEFQAAKQFLAERDLLRGTIGIERDSHHVAADTVEALTSALEGARVVDGSGIVKKVMRTKSPQELALMRKAGKYTAKGMAAAVDAIKAGATDSEVAAAAHYAMIGAGSEWMCSQPYVTTGPRSGVPHTTHMRFTINSGDPVWLEMGGVYERYNCPLMRTVFLGPPPAGAEKLGEAALAALEAILATLKPGVIAEDVAAIASKKLPLDDPEIVFHHTYGYSIGIGFPPGWADDGWLRLIKGRKFVLEPGMVFHCTMGLRRRYKYGFCVSEPVALTEDGCEVLGTFPRQFLYK